MLRCFVPVLSLFFTALLCAEERSFNNEIEYLPDAAATEAARKGERQAKRIQQRRKERGTAGRIAVDTPRFVSQLRADERAERHAKRSAFLDAVTDSFSDPRVRVLPVLTRKSVGVAIVVTTGKSSKKEPSDLAWLYDADDEEDMDQEPSERRAAKREASLTRAERQYINKDSSQRRSRKKLRERD